MCVTEGESEKEAEGDGGTEGEGAGTEGEGGDEDANDDQGQTAGTEGKINNKPYCTQNDHSYIYIYRKLVFLFISYLSY